MNTKRRLIIKIGLVLLCFAIVAFIFIKFEERGLFDGSQDAEPTKGALDYLREKEVVYFDGEAYYPNHSVYSYLFVGLDKHGIRISSDSYNNENNADFIALLVVDGYTREYRILMINRDTMVWMDTYGLGNKKGAQKYQQLTAAHTYGDGLTLSAENVAGAVSNLLYGVEITSYVTVTIDAIERITDEVGGVKVTLEEDYTELDPAYIKGNTIRLGSENVEAFIRSRGEMNEPTNIARMVRQRQFITGFFDKVNADNITDARLADIYSDLSPYMVTNCGISAFTNIVNILKDYKNCGVITPSGTSEVLNGHMAFYADDQELKQTVADLFYRKADLKIN